MTHSHLIKFLPFAIFLLSALTIIARVSRKWGRAGGALRAVLAAFYTLLAFAGLAGLALAGWMAVAGGGKVMLLVVILTPPSFFLISTGSNLSQFVLSPPLCSEAKRSRRKVKNDGASLPRSPLVHHSTATDLR
jgi:hypothetical protein